MKYICINGKITEADKPALMPDNQGYRYGDGLFETLKVQKGEMLLANYHFDRLMAGIRLLQFQLPAFLTPGKWMQEIRELCKKNECEQLCRVRLSLSRGHGGLYDGDNHLQYLIECWPLSESVNRLNENGLVTGLYTEARISADSFASLKSANYLPYVMAARHAKDNKWNECLMLNQHFRVCDATTANVFWVKEGQLFTTDLSEGCVAGVMRRHLVTELKGTNYEVQQTTIIPAELETADELFLTNAIHGIRHVKQLGDKTYSNFHTIKIHQQLFKQL